jgi:hypothetical protein
MRQKVAAELETGALFEDQGIDPFFMIKKMHPFPFPEGTPLILP